MYCDRLYCTKPLPFTPLDWNCPAEGMEPVLQTAGGKLPSAGGAASPCAARVQPAPTPGGWSEPDFHLMGMWKQGKLGKGLIEFCAGVLQDFD